MKRSYPALVLATKQTERFQDAVNALADTANELSFADIALLRRESERQLERLYWEKASAITEQFFSTGQDILLDIFNHFAETEPLSTLLAFSLVNHQWYTLVRQVRHLSLTGHYYLRGSRGPFILNRFRCVESLLVTRNVLVGDCIGPTSSRLTRLEFAPPKYGDNGSGKSTLSLTTLVNLHTLVVRCEHVVLSDISGLSNLTQLDVMEGTLERQYDIEYLPNLRDLRVRGFFTELDISGMTSLRNLDSDEPCHFASYTGHGLMDTEDYADAENPGPVLSAFHDECYDCWASGEWVEGVFTGDAVLSFGRDSSRYEGRYVNGKREGHGRVCVTEKRRIYDAEWRAGLRHGPGSTYTWREPLYWDTNQLVLLSKETWQHGTLVESIPVANDIARDSVEEEERVARERATEMWDLITEIGQSTFLPL